MLNTNTTYATIKPSPHYLVISLKQKQLDHATIKPSPHYLGITIKKDKKKKRNLQRALETLTCKV